MRDFGSLKIAIAGTGYVGLSLAVLLAQHHHVTAVDIIPEKVDLINNRKSPIQDDYIEKYLAEKNLNLIATLDGESAYKDADFVVIAAPSYWAEVPGQLKVFFDRSTPYGDTNPSRRLWRKKPAKGIAIAVRAGSMKKRMCRF